MRNATHKMTLQQPIQAIGAQALPFVPRLLSADLAAVYIGLSKTNFLDRVRTFELPQPQRIGARVLWDRHALDKYADALFGVEQSEDEPEAFDFGV